MQQPLVTVTERDDVGLVDQLMRHRGFRHVPVTRGDQLIGVLTQRDILSGAGWPPSTPVGEVMVRDVKTARPEMPVRHAAKIMRANRISCLPVVDAERRLLGLITEADLVELAGELAEALDREHAEFDRG